MKFKTAGSMLVKCTVDKINPWNIIGSSDFCKTIVTIPFYPLLQSITFVSFISSSYALVNHIVNEFTDDLKGVCGGVGGRVEKGLGRDKIFGIIPLKGKWKGLIWRKYFTEFGQLYRVSQNSPPTHNF